MNMVDEKIIVLDNIMNEQKKILDFLLTADFKIENSYSYTELLLFLKYYKDYYRQIYNSNQDLRGDIKRIEKIIYNLESKIGEKDKKLAIFEKLLENLKKIVTRKLTWKERLLGKIKL